MLIFVILHVTVHLQGIAPIGQVFMAALPIVDLAMTVADGLYPSLLQPFDH